MIRKDSPERKNVEPFGNVIDFYSKKHFQLMMQASYICGTHHPSHIYPTRNKKYVKNIKAKKIFLQHGVFGTKTSHLFMENGYQILKLICLSLVQKKKKI
ncbi:hypothetical protein HRD57_06930 [Tetragenococcus halophilus]|nr:hypothetical protein [Tetragenococcus halophilus]